MIGDVYRTNISSKVPGHISRQAFAIILIVIAIYITIKNMSFWI